MNSDRKLSNLGMVMAGLRSIAVGDCFQVNVRQDPQPTPLYIVYPHHQEMVKRFLNPL